MVELAVGATGEHHFVGPGDIIGRSPLAAICLEDPHVSEAHAMVSLRGADLMLLRLRGRLRVNGRSQAGDVQLTPGLRVELAPGVELRCVAVSLPSSVLGLDIQGLPTFALSGTTSFWSSPPRLAPGAQPDAEAVFWPLGDGWKVTMGARINDIRPGDSVTVGPSTVRVVTVPLAGRGATPTRGASPTNVTFVVSGHIVQLRAADVDIAVVGGMPGRLFAALLRAETPLHWRELVDLLWPDDRAAEHHLRRRFDAALARLREKLVAALDGDLIVLDGAGGAFFRPRPGDRVELNA